MESQRMELKFKTLLSDEELNKVINGIRESIGENTKVAEYLDKNYKAILQLADIIIDRHMVINQFARDLQIANEKSKMTTEAITKIKSAKTISEAKKTLTDLDNDLDGFEKLINPPQPEQPKEEQKPDVVVD